MKQINFRAWNSAIKVLAQVTEIRFSQQAILTTDSKYLWDGRKVLLEQFTGFRDFFGAPIYEGDILEDHEDFTRWVISFSDGGFVGNCTDTEESVSELEGLEVVGNVHENPELLEGSHD